MNTNNADINQMDTNTQPESRREFVFEPIKADIIGGRLDLNLTCPNCHLSRHRTVDYRIVDITCITCDCGAMFDAHVQNVFDAARSPRDEEAVEIVKQMRTELSLCPMLDQCPGPDHKHRVRFEALTVLLERVSPHPVERGEG